MENGDWKGEMKNGRLEIGTASNVSLIPFPFSPFPFPFSFTMPHQCLGYSIRSRLAWRHLWLPCTSAALDYHVAEATRQEA